MNEQVSLIARVFTAGAVICVCAFLAYEIGWVLVSKILFLGGAAFLGVSVFLAVFGNEL